MQMYLTATYDGVGNFVQLIVYYNENNKRYSSTATNTSTRLFVLTTIC